MHVIFKRRTDQSWIWEPLSFWKSGQELKQSKSRHSNSIVKNADKSFLRVVTSIRGEWTNGKQDSILGCAKTQSVTKLTWLKNTRTERWVWSNGLFLQKKQIQKIWNNIKERKNQNKMINIILKQKITDHFLNSEDRGNVLEPYGTKVPGH